MPTYRPPSPLTTATLTLGAIAAIALPGWSQVGSSNYIHNIQGKVEVGRFLIRPDRASEGMLLPTNYQIRLGANSLVILECSNGTTYLFDTAGTYNVSDYCPAGNGGRNGNRNPPRDPFNTSLPYVLSPRNTALIQSNPIVLQWNPVAGATSYTVKIWGRDVDWTTEVSEPTATYTDLAALQPNYTYSIIITADNGLSSAAAEPVSFTVLSSDEAARVRDQLDRIRTKKLELDAEAIALALVYAGYEHSDSDRHSHALNQSAIEVLQKRIAAGTTNAQVYLLQGDIYQIINLPLLARERYQQALALSQESGQRKPQAESYIGLGDIAEGQTEYVDAIRHLQAAQELYEALDDDEEVAALQVRIERLERERR